MNCIHKNGVDIAVVETEEVVITDEQSALDFMATVRYETGADRIVLNREGVAEDFFILKTGLAGAVLQKFANYGFKLALVGDFSSYSDSRAFRDFMYECNNGRDVFFAVTTEEAAERLAGV